MSRRSRFVALALSFFGFLGLHRFYLGRFWTGLLMLITIGGFGVWWIWDVFLLLTGKLRDGDDLELTWFGGRSQTATQKAVVPPPQSFEEQKQARATEAETIEPEQDLRTTAGMSSISLPGQTKITTLQERFKSEFGLTLRVYDGRKYAEPDATIGKVRKKRGATSVDIRRNTKVGNLEDRFLEEFGIKVQIAGSDDSYLCDDELTLAAALAEDERKLERKAKRSATGEGQIVGAKIEAENKQNIAPKNKSELSVITIQNWVQNSNAKGTIDGDGDLYVSTETTAEITTDEPTKLYLFGTQKLEAGGKNETFEISDQVTTNEVNWIRSDFLKGVGSDNTQFSYNLDCEVYSCVERVVVPVKLKKGKVPECPINADKINLSELKFVFVEDNDFRAEGTIKGPSGFVYAFEILTEEPDEGYFPSANKASEGENSAEVYEFLWDIKMGDTAFVVLCGFEKLDGKLSCEFSSDAEVDEPASHNDFSEDDTDDFEAPEIDDVETKEGDIGRFEFQIKRGIVDEDANDEDIQNLIDQLKQLCEEGNYEEAAKLLLSRLSFEFGPDQLDDDPERFFSNTDYIELDCTSENASVGIGYDDYLVVTISVQFEIPLKAGISTAELEEYLPDSGAWASASASPGWGYTESDGENVWFLGLKNEGDKASETYSNTRYVCLDFGGANCTYIETDENHLDEEDDLSAWFVDQEISEDDAVSWATKNLTVTFDGDLDDPEKFKSIKAIGVYGPNFVEIGEGSCSISGFAVYLEVEVDDEITEEEFEDIFHVVIPVIESNNGRVAFTEFDDYSILLEAPSNGVRPINVIWPGVESA